MTSTSLTKPYLLPGALTTRCFLATILLSLLLPALTGCAAQSEAQSSPQHDDNPVAPHPPVGQLEVQVWVSAAHTTTSWDTRDPERHRFDLPVVYLHREQEAAAEVDRVLEINISGVADNTAVEIEAVSWHVDVSTGARHTETRRFVTPDRPCTPDAPCTLLWTLDPTTMLSDLYTIRVKGAAEGATLWTNPDPDRPDFVALDTWDIMLGSGADSAQPMAHNGRYTVRVYYATLFPFARGQIDLDNRLQPAAVTDFIANQFVPIIADTWHTQVEAWGFGDPLHPDWDADNVVEIIITHPPFTLFDGAGTYTVSITTDGRPYPERRIWWHSNNNTFQAYDTLEKAYKAVFAHEFFHLMQWNVRLSSQAYASTGRPTNRWLNLFIEAQGKFVPSIQFPEIELGEKLTPWGNSEYVSAANGFLASRLNTSYRDLETGPVANYDFALYWRFLYEQFNDLAVVRAALEEMVHGYDREVVDPMKIVMDKAFARFDRPFQTFEESLIAFARANYALRLEDERCANAHFAECGGRYYDPESRYVDPPLEAKLKYDGTLLSHGGSIPASYGMDFFEVDLAYVAQDQPLTIKFQSEGAIARFNVQVWMLGRGSAKPRAVTSQPGIAQQNGAGAHVYVIPHIGPAACNRLALIITRLDPHETNDPTGNYRFSLDSCPVTDDKSSSECDRSEFDKTGTGWGD